MEKRPATITEAQSQGGFHLVRLNQDVNMSSSRAIPYSEIYSGRTSVMETPAQRRQKAAEDEERRQSAPQ